MDIFKAREKMRNNILDNIFKYFENKIEDKKIEKIVNDYILNLISGVNVNNSNLNIYFKGIKGNPDDLKYAKDLCSQVNSFYSSYRA